MRNWKVIAVSGAAGFLLSLLFGAFAGNPFGVVLLRVILCTAGAAGLAFGLKFIVGRFLPEISAGAGEGLAEHVDIVVPGENPHEAREEDAGAEASEEGIAATAAGGETPAAEEVPVVDELDLGDAGSPEAAAEAEPIVEAGGAASLAGRSRSQASPGGLDTLGGRAETVTAGGQQHDVETVAKAVRTMMKRDEEG